MHCKRAMALFGVTMSLLIGVSNVFALESNTQDIDTLDNINGIQNHRGVLVDQGKFTNELYYDDVDAWDIIDEDAVDFEVRINPDKNKIYIKYFQDDGLGLMTLKNGSYYDVYRVNDNLTLSLYNGEGLYTLGLYRRIDLTSGKSHEQDVLRIESSNNTSITASIGENAICTYKDVESFATIANSMSAKSTSTHDYIMNCYKYVVESLDYDTEFYNLKTSGGTIEKYWCPNVEATIEKGKGICCEQASLMASLLRCKGIPTRIIYGYLLDDDNSFHAWVEAYEDGQWVFYDPTWQIYGNNNAHRYILYKYC